MEGFVEELQLNLQKLVDFKEKIHFVYKAQRVVSEENIEILPYIGGFVSTPFLYLKRKSKTTN